MLFGKLSVFLERTFVKHKNTLCGKVQSLLTLPQMVHTFAAGSEYLIDLLHICVGSGTS
jgi:hypothetical protein